MGPGGTAGGAHQRNHLALFYHLPLSDQVDLVVAVAGDVAVAMADFDEIAIAAASARPGDHAGGDTDHHTALCTDQVDAVVVDVPCHLERVLATHSCVPPR